MAGGDGQFHFLPPMAPNPSYTGVFDASLSPVVEICEWAGEAGCAQPPIAAFTTGKGSAAVKVNADSEHYSRFLSWAQ